MNEHESDAPPVINRQLPPAPPVIGSNPPPDLPRPEERPGVADARSESRLKKLLGSLGVVGVLLLKLGAKLKLIILPAIKFFPVLFKTGGTMKAPLDLIPITKPIYAQYRDYLEREKPHLLV